MAGNNDNDNFWEDKKDDFWNKSVISDDWLKEETAFFGTEPEYREEQKEITEPAENMEQTESVFERSFDKNLNPFIESHKHDDWVINTEIPKKKKHIHTIICLASVLVAVLFIASCFLKFEKDKKNAFAINRKLVYDEIKVGDDPFYVYENNRVMLENRAYTIIDADTVPDFPEGEKLIAIYVQVNSDEYKLGKDALDGSYIGYQTPEGEEFKLGLYGDTILPYITDLGFSDSDILSIFGIGNGLDQSGYYFYFVPEGVEQITFYAQEKKKFSWVNVVSCMYEKEMTVLEIDQWNPGGFSERRTQ